MALFQAITGFAHLPRGFRNRDLRPTVAALLGRPYSAAQMTYDLPVAAQRPNPSDPHHAPVYRHQLWPQGGLLRCEALSPDLPTPVAGAALDALDVQIRKIHEEAALAA